MHTCKIIWYNQIYLRHMCIHCECNIVVSCSLFCLSEVFHLELKLFYLAHESCQLAQLSVAQTHLQRPLPVIFLLPFFLFCCVKEKKTSTYRNFLLNGIYHYSIVLVENCEKLQTAVL